MNKNESINEILAKASWVEAIDKPGTSAFLGQVIVLSAEEMGDVKRFSGLSGEVLDQLEFEEENFFFMGVALDRPNTWEAGNGFSVEFVRVKDEIPEFSVDREWIRERVGREFYMYCEKNGGDTNGPWYTSIQLRAQNDEGEWEARNFQVRLRSIFD